MIVENIKNDNRKFRIIEETNGETELLSTISSVIQNMLVYMSPTIWSA
jgi:hypothetical protein